MQNKTDENIQPTEQPVKKHCSRGGKMCAFIITLILLALIGYNYVRTEQLKRSLTPVVNQLQTETKADVIELKKSMTDLQKVTEKSTELSQKQEQIIAEWQAAQKGDLEKWHIAEAQYLVKLANDHVQFTHNITLALTLLQRADQVLQETNDTGLLDIRQALATDLANLKALPEVDVTGLYAKLAAIGSQVNQLPLPASPLGSASDITPTKTPSNASWWQAGIDRSWDALRQVVIVKKITGKDSPLVMPEEKAFLYQNLHAQIEDAMWGVLHRNNQVYQASLARSVTWVKTYFVQDVAETKNVLQSLTDLQKENVDAPSANLAETLRLFDAYFAAQQH
ncbi:MAG: uroporphyrinogen-III C-methyltransferase [Gammaproteobacteria bacterium]